MFSQKSRIWVNSPCLHVKANILSDIHNYKLAPSIPLPAATKSWAWNCYYSGPVITHYRNNQSFKIIFIPTIWKRVRLSGRYLEEQLYKPLLSYLSYPWIYLWTTSNQVHFLQNLNTQLSYQCPCFPKAVNTHFLSKSCQKRAGESSRQELLK